MQHRVDDDRSRGSSSIGRERPASPSGSGAGPDGADPFLLRLRLLTGLDDAEIRAIEQLYGTPRTVRPRTELFADGEEARRIHVLLDGWACRYRLLADGRRQITAVMIPGDLCDLDALYLEADDSAVATITACTLAVIDVAGLRTLVREQPRIGEALGWLGAVENAILAERNACLGRLSAREHLAHLLCEMMIRQTLVGKATADRFALPLTQEDIADVLGLTAVHVNRVLQGLRSGGLIAQRQQWVTVSDWLGLRDVASFRPNYLHLEGLDGAGRGRAVAPWSVATTP